MFEDMTFDNIMADMLSDAEDGVSTAEGSFLYAACAKTAIELESLAPRLESLYSNLSINTQEEDILIAGGRECGVPIEEADAAVFKAQFNCPVPDDTRFSHLEQEYNYYVVETLDEEQHICRVECEEVGTEPGRFLGELEPLEELEGFEWGKLIEVIDPGKDQEDIDAYRLRRVDYFGIKAFAGNRKYYRQEAGALRGVGAVKINRRLDGEETLILVVANETFGAPDEEEIAELQEQVDPLLFTGDGIGIAPVEHKIVVMAADEVPVNLETSLALEENLTAADVQARAETALEEYLAEVAQAWADTNQLTVVMRQIEARILEIEGVLDVYDTKLNGLEQNLILGVFELPKKGVVRLV